MAAFLELIRLRNTLIAFVGVVLGAKLAGDITVGVLYAGLSAFLVTGAGNALNDFFDYEIDRINRPSRPLPSGKIGKNTTVMLAIVLFIVGIALASLINIYCLGLALVNSMVLILYAKYSKKLLLTANMAVSYLSASTFVYGGLATLKPMHALTVSDLRFTVVLGVCAFFLSIAREITKDIEDIEGDKKLGGTTLPIVVGVDTAKKITFFFILIAVLASMTPLVASLCCGFWAGRVFNRMLYTLFIMPADIIFISSALVSNPGKAQRTMVLGMLVALLAFYAGTIA